MLHHCYNILRETVDCNLEQYPHCSRSHVDRSPCSTDHLSGHCIDSALQECPLTTSVTNTGVRQG